MNGLYEVSNLGRIKSLNYRNQKNKSKIMKPKTDKNGYYRIEISNLYKKRKTFAIHRLVAQAFIPNPNNKPCVNHKDGNKQNNTINNLEWVSKSENLKHAWDNKLITNTERRKSNGITLGKKYGGYNKKKVKQYDLNNKFIKEWNSLADVEKEMNIDHRTISACCLGKQKTSGGFVWKY